MQHHIPAMILGALGSLILGSTWAGQSTSTPSFQDALDVPAVRVEGAAIPERQPMLAVVQAGDRLVSAGLRGLVLLSDDRGHSWRQAQVPVQSDLTALHFPTPQKGWAVGHEGVILHSSDGGETWHKQLDGREAAAVLAPFYEERLAAGDDSIQPYLEQLLFNTETGAILPYLGVHFDDEQIGYVVGAFGMARKTADGGKTWMPWLHRMDNDHFLNLNDIQAVGSDVYVAGEQGTVFRLDREADHFVAVHTDYRGSFFGVTGDNHQVIVFGLRGHAFTTNDRGATWRALETGVEDSFTAGAVSDDGKVLLLVSAGGRLALSQNGGRHFETRRAPRSMLYAGATATQGGHFVLAGWHGLVENARTMKLKQEHNQSQEVLP